jgi:hypothetical protein
VDVAVAEKHEVLRLSLNNNLELVSGRIQESKARFYRETEAIFGGVGCGGAKAGGSESFGGRADR